MADSKRSATRVTLRDVVKLSGERTNDPDSDGFERYVGLEHIDPGDLTIRRWGDVADGTTFTTIFRRGEVLFGKRRAYQRKVAVPDFEGVCSGDLYVLVPTEPSILLPEFLPFICQTDDFFDHAVRTSAGSLSPRTNWQSIGSYEFLLPTLEYQREIVGALGSIDTFQNSLRNLFQQVVQLRTAHLSAALNALSYHPVVPLSEVATRVGVGIASSVTHAYSDAGVPIIQNSNIRPGAIDFTEGRYVSEVFDRANATKRLKSGDVIIARTGVPGAAVVIPDEYIGGHTFTTLIVSPDRSRLSSKFLELWINSIPGRSFFASRKAGGVQQNMNATVLRDLPVPLIPWRDQEAIIEAQDTFDQTVLAIRRRQLHASVVRDVALRRLASTGGNSHV